MTTFQIGLSIAALLLIAAGHLATITWFLAKISSKVRMIEKRLEEVRHEQNQKFQRVNERLDRLADQIHEEDRSLQVLITKVGHLEREMGTHGGEQ